MDGSVTVGVQSDGLTPSTDVVFSLQRQSNWNMGTDQFSGGNFCVGNPANVEGGSVKFRAILNGSDATWKIGKNAFVGFAACAFNKRRELNGGATQATNPVLDGAGKAMLDEDGLPVFTADTENGSSVQALQQVDKIEIIIEDGEVRHNQTFDGSNRAASMMAFGPCDDYNVSVSGPDNAILCGGGNVMFVPNNGAFPINVWDYAGLLPGGEQYGICPTVPMVIIRDGDFPAPTSGIFGLSGRFYVNLSQERVFDLMSQTVITGMPVMMASIARTDDADTRVGFINNDVLNTVYPTDAPAIRRVLNGPIVGQKATETLRICTIAARGEGLLDPTDFGLIPDRN